MYFTVAFLAQHVFVHTVDHVLFARYACAKVYQSAIEARFALCLDIVLLRLIDVAARFTSAIINNGINVDTATIVKVLE
jgi:hypothetical protein